MFRKTKPVKETIPFKKCNDSIVEIEVALQKIRQELNDKEQYTVYAGEMLNDVRKALIKLHTYLPKLPME